MHLPKKKGHEEQWEETDETDESDPSETTKKNKKKVKVPRTIKVLIKKKYKASRKLKEAIAHEDILKAKGEIVKLDNKLKLFYDNARAEEEEKVLDNIKYDPKRFY